jgi:hypothetical protein
MSEKAKILKNYIKQIKEVVHQKKKLKITRSKSIQQNEE